MKKLLATLAVALMTTNAFAGILLSTPRPVVEIERLDFDQRRMVVLKGPIRDTTAVRNALAKLDKSSGPITMIINSPGGGVVTGFELIQTMEALDNPLTCIIEKEAFSMAALVAMYCPKLYVQKFAMAMFHQASYSVQGNQTEIKTRVNTLEKHLDQVMGDTARKMGLTLEQFKDRIHDEWWLSANEMVSSGLADAKLLKLKYEYKEPEEDILFKIFGLFKLPLQIFKDPRS